MNDSTPMEFPCSEVLNIFDVLILQIESDSQCRCMSALPSWYPDRSSGAHSLIPPEEFLRQSYFLQWFVSEAESFWRARHQGTLASGLWSEPGLLGDESYFEATALVHGEHRMLIIQRHQTDKLFQEPVLQKARDEHLAHGRERRARNQVEADLGRQLQASEQVRDDVMAVLDHLHLAIILIDHEGVLTYASPAVFTIFDFDHSELVGLPWWQALSVTTEQRRQIEDQLVMPESSRTSVDFSVQKRGKSNLEITLEAHNDPRNPQRMILFLKDRTEVETLRRQLIGEAQFERLIGKSPAMQMIYQKIQEIAAVDVPVLIQGETGTGKELVAQALHRLSTRQGQPFIAVNCAGLTDSLLGSQLFGHKRGAFTGAVSDHEGYFEAAEGGILFLDEIGDMPLTIQTTLLRVLQEGEIIRLGESHPRTINVRVIAATHQDLQKLVDNGSFRSDLLYRIRVARLHLPPLRERREDIALLSEAFLGQARAITKKYDVKTILPAAMQALLRYDWPGNVRELKSTFDYALIHCCGPNIQRSDLPPEIVAPAISSEWPKRSSKDERADILAALEQTQGKRAAAAKLLGVSRSTLYRRLSELEISSEE